MKFKSIILCVFSITISCAVTAQKIIVDTTSTNKYIINRPSAKTEPKKEELTFGDRAISIGSGILNRLKARLNLEEASESLKAKKEKFLGRREDDNQDKGT